MEKPLYENESAALNAPGEIYRHYKDGIYRLIERGVKHSETLELGVYYEHLWPHDHGFWYRPESVFFDELPDGTARFTRVK